MHNCGGARQGAVPVAPGYVALTHSNVTTFGLLLFVACVVSIVTRRVGLPYAIGLVATGLGLGLAGVHLGLQLTSNLIFTVLLPPLIFEASLHLDWPEFRREAPLVLNLAFCGTVLSAAVVAAGMHWLVGWGWQAATLFGALIAATDPVSVIAIMKEQDADRRLRFLMESESLCNDGAAAVLFALCVSAIDGGSLSVSHVALSIVLTVGGGVLCGLLVAGALLLLTRQADDHLTELAITALAAYGSFLLAEMLDVSPVLATMAAGMLVHNWGRGRHLSKPGGDSVNWFWDFAAFLANSVIFLLIGTRTAAQPFLAYLRPALAGIVFALLGRAAAIYLLSAVHAGGPRAIATPMRHLLFWGGLRGALAAALALLSPDTLPEHDALVGSTLAVIAFSIFVQGLSVPVLLRRFHLLSRP